MHKKHYIQLALAISSVCAWHAQTANAQLPDLRPEVNDVSITVNQTVDEGDVIEGCAASTTGRTLIRFGHTAWNEGLGDLVLGDPDCGDCSLNPGQTCGNPRFICSGAGGHGHPHLQEFSTYKVYNEAGTVTAAEGHKEGFCLTNMTCNGGIPDTSSYPACSILSAGCADIYSSGLGCQYVDITGLAPGRYRLDVSINPLQTLLESSYDNNTQQVLFTICAPKTALSGAIDVRFPKDSTGVRTFKLGLTTRISNLQGEFSPLRDALTLSITSDTGLGAYTSSLPTIRRREGCDPRDGWRRTKAGWEYNNFSGYADASCQTPLPGLSRVVVRKSSMRRRHYEIRANGKLSTTDLAGKISSLQVVASVPSSAGATINQTCDVSALLKPCKLVGPDSTLHMICKK